MPTQTPQAIIIHTNVIQFTRIVEWRNQNNEQLKQTLNLWNGTEIMF